MGGTTREYKMYIKDETTQEWLVDLHDAMTRDTLDFLKDIKNKEGSLFKWYLTLELMFHKLPHASHSTVHGRTARTFAKPVENAS